jgi:hypothetical protein
MISAGFADDEQDSSTDVDHSSDDEVILSLRGPEKVEQQANE